MLSEASMNISPPQLALDLLKTLAIGKAACLPPAWLAAMRILFLVAPVTFSVWNYSYFSAANDKARWATAPCRAFPQHSHLQGSVWNWSVWVCSYFKAQQTARTALHSDQDPHAQVFSNRICTLAGGARCWIDVIRSSLKQPCENESHSIITAIRTNSKKMSGSCKAG